MFQFLKRWRSILGILAGISLCLFIVSIVSNGLACIGLLIGEIVAPVIADVSSPKEGAVIGALIPIPIGIYITMPLLIGDLQQHISIFSLILGEILGTLFLMGVGAVLGLLIGKFLESRKKGNALLF